jgi:hypothetical protein
MSPWNTWEATWDAKLLIFVHVRILYNRTCTPGPGLQVIVFPGLAPSQPGEHMPI